MLKFPRSLDEIDPISYKVRRVFDPNDFLSGAWVEEKEIKPHLFQGENGKMRYAPPLPPKEWEVKKSPVDIEDKIYGFYPGAKVVCIDPGSPFLEKGKIYTIVALTTVEGQAAISLADRPSTQKWYSRRFRLAEILPKPAREFKIGDKAILVG